MPGASPPEVSTPIFFTTTGPRATSSGSPFVLRRRGVLLRDAGRAAGLRVVVHLFHEAVEQSLDHQIAVLFRDRALEPVRADLVVLHAVVRDELAIAILLVPDATVVRRVR